MTNSIDYTNPPYARKGSEVDRPDAPLCRTSTNYESIKVCRVDNVAVRIAKSGYRILFGGSNGKYFPREDIRHNTVGLVSTEAVKTKLKELAEEGSVTPKTVAAVCEALEAWPNRAGVAWSQLHPGQYTGDFPAYAPEGLPTLRAALRGV